MNTSPWQVSPEELLSLKGKGGQAFAEFCSALIHAEGTDSQLNLDQIDTNVRVNISDGGVDAVVKGSLAGALQIATASVWQFKAGAFSAVSEAQLRIEVNKPEAKRLITLGFSYCLCVCDDATPPKRRALDEVLAKIVRAIDPAAPLPRIFGISDLAAWTNRHPGVVLRFFRPYLGNALTYESWLRKERNGLPKYVTLPSRASQAGVLRDHVAQSAAPCSVLKVSGPAGAGISRFVAETLAEIALRVIYIPDAAAAVSLVTGLVNQPSARAVLVIDRCSRSVLSLLEELLGAEGSRLRAIVIPDTTQPVSDRAAIQIAKLDSLELQQILDVNFPEVPSQHSRAFVHLADGVAKVAATLAARYIVNPTAALRDAACWAEDELGRLIPDPADQRLLEGLALFNRIGYCANVAEQLASICRWLNIADSSDAIRRLRRLSSSPGVIELGPRYASVRPRLFARPLFESGWNALLRGRLAQALGELPAELVTALLKQAAGNGHHAARGAIADWALPWATALEPAELLSAEVVARLIVLVEVSAKHFGPVLAHLVMRADATVASASGEKLDGWQTRLHVVWKLEQLLERRSTFPLAERALYRLARAEGVTALDAGELGPAIEKWTSCFGLYLAGTEVPFKERMAVLQSTMDSDGSDSVPFVVAALKSALSTQAFKSFATPLAGGELRPVDWHPRTYGELWECLDAALAVLGCCLKDRVHGERAFRVLLKSGREVLRGRRLQQLRDVVELVELNEFQRVGLLGLVEDFLAYDVSEEDAESEYVQAVSSWRKTLQRRDLAGRVFEAVSFAASRDAVERETEWTQGLEALGRELVESPAVLTETLPALVMGDRHHGGALFTIARAIGRVDCTAALLSPILAATGGDKDPVLARGYVRGLAEQGETHDAAVAVELAQLEARQPLCRSI